jgi:ketosteroid isomerase-like protein
VASRDSGPIASANLTLVQSIYTAWGRGDLSSADWAHPEIEFAVEDGLSPGRWTGRAGMADAMRNLLSAWRNLSVEADEYRELEGERVLVLHRYIASGKTSGLELREMQANAAGLFHLSDHKVTKLAIYFDRSSALADAGVVAL